MKSKTKEIKELSVEIEIPEGVNTNLDGSILILKGLHGEVKRNFNDKRISLEKKEKSFLLKALKVNKMNKKILKTYSAHIKNMVRGCKDGHEYILKICSGHFPMNVSVSNGEFVVKNFLGEKVPRVLKLKKDSIVKVEGDKVIVQSSSKELAGQVSADIEQLTRRTRYDSRIFQDGIYIITKDSKEIN